MQMNRVTSNRWSMSLALVALAVCAACADDTARVGAAEIGRPARLPAPASPDVGADAGAPEGSFIELAGRVVDDLEKAVSGRPLVVVDGRGRRQEVYTDEDGAFRASGVAAPYDLLVTQASSGAVVTPLVFLGLHRADPRIEVFEGQGPTTRPASQPIRVGVKLPECRAIEGSCWVSVVTASASGSGATAGSFTAGAASGIYDVDHAWREPNTRPGESIDVHILVGDARYSEYSYARVIRIAARPGEPTDLGMLMPLPVESTDPVSVAGHANGLPTGWQWTLASQLELPGGATIAMRYDWAAASAMRLPQLPGATWHVGAWMQHPPTPERPYFHRSSQAWSGTLPLTTTNVSIDVPSAPETMRPAMEGTLSRRGPGFGWDGRAPALASLVVVDLARGRQRFHAFTADAEVPLARLEALGLAKLEPGEHVLDLTTTPGTSVDELTQPDPRQRKGRFDPQVPGATTYQRFQFMVTQ
jgi:hypothetical protein